MSTTAKFRGEGDEARMALRSAHDAHVRHFIPSASSTSEARRFVSSTLRTWACNTLIDDAALIISELATNAVRHARSDFTVGLIRTDEYIELTVSDASPVTPLLRAAHDEAETGRGLSVVAALATSWGYTPQAMGKSIWVRLGIER